MYYLVTTKVKLQSLSKSKQGMGLALEKRGRWHTFWGGLVQFGLFVLGLEQKDGIGAGKTFSRRMSCLHLRI